MPEWLETTFAADQAIHPLTLALRLLLALACGCVIAGIYRITRVQTGAQSSAMLATFVMLTVLIAMVTQIIGDNIARAFSLVGALAIVRFRTVVEDTRDTAFVIFAVTVGMALGGGSIAIPLIGIPIVAAAAFLFRARTPAQAFNALAPVYTLTIRVGPAHIAESHLQGAFEPHLASWRLAGMTSARAGAAYDKTYTIQPKAGADISALVAALNRLEGVQSVALQ